ncbi:MAG: branched-chain amino acid ABC transporter permease, partial [Gammaproteobacteria bacterium]|nr:branched-chain amino acid ABC transporter permease [Gammaproteobacteria bacterium]
MLRSNPSAFFWLPAAAVIALFCIAPQAISAYRLELLTIFLINVILAQSYRLMTTTGDWTLCHYILMGVGAYSTGILAKKYGMPFYTAMPLAAAITVSVSFVLALPLSRTIGFAFFIASFALGEFIRHIWLKFHNPFGGARGVNGIPKLEFGQPGDWYFIDFWDSTNFYFFTLIFTVMALIALYRIDRSRVGNIWKSIYADRELCGSIGINVTRYRILLFCVSGFFAGIAGSLLAYQIGSIDPHNFEMVEMVYLIIWVVVGGVKTYWGPLIGVLSMSLVFELTRPLQEWRPLLFGLILILFLVFMPGGLETLGPR